MSTQIGLNPVYEYRINLDKTSVFLFYDDGHEFKALTSDLVVAIIDKLKSGHENTRTILETLSGQYGVEEIEYVLHQLMLDRYIVGLAPEIPDDLVEQWSSIEHPPIKLQKALNQTNVALVTIGVDSASFYDRLEFVGVKSSAIEQADFAVVLTENVLAPELEVFNIQAMQNKLPWMLARVVGQKLWFTAFEPGETPCWHCFARAVQRNRAGMLWFDTTEHQLYRASRRHSTDRVISPMGAAHLENLVLHRIFYGHFGPVKGNLFLIDARTGDVDLPRSYPLASLCPYCNEDQGSRVHAFVPLKSRAKIFTDDGGHRSADPRTAFNTYAHLIDPYVGFFRNLRRLDAGDNELVHIFMMQYCQTALLPDSAALLETDTGYSYGKGISEWQSKASCLFEAIERYSGQWRQGIPVVSSSYAAMKQRVIHPHDLLLFSNEQYQNREEWNNTCPEKFSVFEPFNDQEVIEWVATYSLNSGEEVFIPAAYGYYYYRGPGSSFVFADSNGCSAGLTREEAILQGLLELVERDTLALAFGHRAPFTRVDLTGVQLPYFEEMVAYLRSRKRTLEVFRVPSLLDIPCYIALSECEYGEKSILTGFGCHLDPVIAVSRAVTELGQTLYGEEYDAGRRANEDPYSEKKYQQASWLKKNANGPKEKLVSTKKRTTDDIAEDIRICIKMLEEQNLEVLVLDQTDAEIGCPVVKVIVPGMYQFWGRKGGRRMKEVPVRAGWCDEVAREEDIEPVWFVAG